MNRMSNRWSAAMAALAIGGCLVSSARAASIYGPPSQPEGINDLSITYSGGTALFNVRFDERSFDDVYAGSPTFTTDADVSAAMTAILDFLVPLNEFLGSTPTFDGTQNNALFYPSIVDSIAVTRYFKMSRSPAGWGHPAFETSLDFTRDQSMPDLGYISLMPGQASLRSPSRRRCCCWPWAA